jgi:hypothetical protein
LSEFPQDLAHSAAEGYDAKDVRSLAHPKRVYTGLLADPGPSSIERPSSQKLASSPNATTPRHWRAFF